MTRSFCIWHLQARFTKHAKNNNNNKRKRQQGQDHVLLIVSGRLLLLWLPAHEKKLSYLDIPTKTCLGQRVSKSTRTY